MQVESQEEGAKATGRSSGRGAVLTVQEIKSAPAPAAGTHKKLAAGKGLHLLMDSKGGRYWHFRYRHEGKEKMLSFGTYPQISLKDAHTLRDEARTLVARGIDPSAKRKADKAASGLAQANTFRAVALEWLTLQERKLSTAGFAKSKWLLEDLLFPYIGEKPISEIGASDLLEALRRTEARGRHESAHRAKWKAGQVFRYAIATGRAKHNPAAREYLGGALAPFSVKHRAAITEPRQAGALLLALDSYTGQPGTEYALKLAPLLFARPGELRGARWEEFTVDGDAPLWRIPAERMKMKREHLIPLSRQALKLLRELLPITGPKGLLFPSLRTAARPISENTVNAALRRLGYSKDEMTGHGFRAMASTLLTERGYPAEIVELQLAHEEKNKVRAAYNRAQRLPDRTKMMQEWADYLDDLKSAAMGKRKAA